ncbi:MAG: helix-hairpin-helix domain-containing protein [Coriobacteriia bacterium]|nr:helix-hairpin-helix domain-containing protein [Coriobacteriia bacterium]
MDNPRYERYLTSTSRRPSRWDRIEARIRHTCNDLAHKIGLRQLKPRTALVAGLLFVVVVGFGLVRSGVFHAPAAASGGAATAARTTAPVPSTPAQGTETTVTVHVVVDQQGVASAPGDTDAASTAGGAAQPADGKINLNTADEAALETLPGIGPVTAKKIIADRTANGRFTSPEDLMRVSGIGPKKYDAIKDLVTAP